MRTRKQGQALVEYVLIVSLLALVTLAALTGMGDAASRGLLEKISTNLSTANNSISSGS
jgi:Flp pilus assembly pilin Flp